MENIWVICGKYLFRPKIVYGLVWVFFSEWANEIKAQKFVPQQLKKKKKKVVLKNNKRFRKQVVFENNFISFSQSKLLNNFISINKSFFFTVRST